jgi:hypothetical protein
MSNHIIKNSVFNIKQYKNFYNYKNFLSLLFFKNRNKIIKKNLKKNSYIYYFLKKWYYFKAHLGIQKYKYSFFLLRQYYFFIFFLMRLVLKMVVYCYTYFFSKYITKNFYNNFFYLKLLAFYMYYKKFLFNNKRLKKFTIFKKKFLLYNKNAIKNIKKEFVKKKKKYLYKYKYKKLKNILILLGKGRFNRINYLKIRKELFYFNITNMKKNKKKKCRKLNYITKFLITIFKKMETKKIFNNKVSIEKNLNYSNKNLENLEKKRFYPLFINKFK